MDTNPRSAGTVSDQNRNPALGLVLTCLGWALRILGMMVASSGYTLVRPLVTEPGEAVAALPSWLRLVILLVVLVFGGLLFGWSYPLLVRGARHRARTITSFEQLAGVRYVLYLRSFALDTQMARPTPQAPGFLMGSPFEVPGRTQEEFLIRQVSHLGRVIAVGQPGERLPLLGAQRGYLPLDDWQDTVSALIQGAHVVVMSAAQGPGTVWEFTETLRTLSPIRLVLLVNCTTEEYDTFRAAVAEEYAARSDREAGPFREGAWPPLPRLPDLPPPRTRTRRSWDLPLRASIVFDHAWRATLIPFEPVVPRVRLIWTVRRLVRRELKPVLGPLSRLPPPAPPSRGRTYR
ncbi:hypothetical protein [Nocardiopsis sp. FIRDI 009]|uniref:hypothetical protein n=1 Tax=Nocardiopsis sp. FIRDI 009 TaxID=714197 RepID=UPI0018E57840|nr:hypothetical protein [Nocardiopsis sp. FIRDI 009]